MYFTQQSTIQDMKVSEAFLVNTKNFDPIIETLVKYDAQNIVINSTLLETLSYSDPNDLLVIRILKDFQIIDNNGKPDVYFEEFQNPKTTKRALAKGLISAYEGIFDQDSSIHKHSDEKVKELFDQHFKGQKTDLIIKYISGTFCKVVSYVGTSTIDAVLNNDSSAEEEQIQSSKKSVLKETKKVAQATFAENHATNGEEISDQNIDDLLADFDLTNASSNSTSSINESPTPGHNNDNHENASSSEDEIWGLDERPSPNKKLPDKQATDTPKAKNADVAPIDLEMPLSMATPSESTMEDITNEQKFVQKALIRKSDLLHKLKRWEELVPTLEIIINRYDNQQNMAFNEAIERAVIRRAVALLKLGRSEQALPALNAVIDRFKDSENADFYEQASRAMLYKISILEKKDPLNEQLMPLYNAVIDRMESSSELLVNEKIDEIHCKRFDLLIKNNEDKLTLLDASKKLIARFKDSSKFRDYLQKAMIIRAETLDEMNQDEEALKAYDEFLALFGN